MHGPLGIATRQRDPRDRVLADQAHLAAALRGQPTRRLVEENGDVVEQLAASRAWSVCHEQRGVDGRRADHRELNGDGDGR